MVQRCHFPYYAEPVYEVLYESAKISSLRSIRDDKTHEESVAVHRAFGDIFMAYEAYKRKLISFYLMAHEHFCRCPNHEFHTVL